MNGRNSPDSQARHAPRFHLQPAPDSPRLAQPLLFVHCAWHGAWCWNERFLPYFADHGFEVLALDLPGHGDGTQPARSIRGLGVADWRAMADCLIAWLRARRS